MCLCKKCLCKKRKKKKDQKLKAQIDLSAVKDIDPTKMADKESFITVSAYAKTDRSQTNTITVLCHKLQFLKLSGPTRRCWLWRAKMRR